MDLGFELTLKKHSKIGSLVSHDTELMTAGIVERCGNRFGDG